MPEEHPAHRGAGPQSITDTTRCRTTPDPYQVRRAVNIPLKNGHESMIVVDLLRKTWRMFWDCSGSDILAELPLYIKD